MAKIISLQAAQLRKNAAILRHHSAIALNFGMTNWAADLTAYANEIDRCARIAAQAQESLFTLVNLLDDIKDA